MNTENMTPDWLRQSGELIEKTKTAFGWIPEIVLRSDH